MNAGLMWFTRGFVEYQFPNNARLIGKAVTALEFSLELSSEVPGTSADWPSDITVAINGKELGAWTSPGDFGDKRGVYTPDWWKLKGSQYGKLKSWRVTPDGAFIDGLKISPLTLDQLRYRRPPLDPAQDRGEARRAPSRRRQRLRPRLRQLRPGHIAQADDRAVILDRFSKSSFDRPEPSSRFESGFSRESGARPVCLDLLIRRNYGTRFRVMMSEKAKELAVARRRSRRDAFVSDRRAWQ